MKAHLQRIFLTACLCGGTFFLGYQFGNTKTPAPKPRPVAVTQLQDAGPRSSPESQDHFQPFRWSQLESTDYRNYIANLRSIGCPEQTIRDIITADVDSVFARRRDRLIGSTPSGLVKDGLSALRQQEDQFLTTLLGSQSDKAAEVAVAPETVPLRRARNRDAVPALPLVLQNVDLTGLKLNSSQMEVVENLRREFRLEIGSASDPNDPAYRERWLAAQHESDSLLQGMLGTDIYMNYLGLAANQSPERAQ
jgi:hypothetical protein